MHMLIVETINLPPNICEKNWRWGNKVCWNIARQECKLRKFRANSTWLRWQWKDECGRGTRRGWWLRISEQIHLPAQASVHRDMTTHVVCDSNHVWRSFTSATLLVWHWQMLRQPGMRYEMRFGVLIAYATVLVVVKCPTHHLHPGHLGWVQKRLGDIGELLEGSRSLYRSVNHQDWFKRGSLMQATPVYRLRKLAMHTLLTCSHSVDLWLQSTIARPSTTTVLRRLKPPAASQLHNDVTVCTGTMLELLNVRFGVNFHCHSCDVCLSAYACGLFQQLKRNKYVNFISKFLGCRPTQKSLKLAKFSENLYCVFDSFRS